MYTLSPSYIAGLFDGVGGVYITQQARAVGFGRKITVGTRDKGLLILVQGKYGGSLSGNRSGGWRWESTNRKEILEFLRDVKPYLNSKLLQAEVMLEICELPNANDTNGVKEKIEAAVDRLTRVKAAEVVQIQATEEVVETKDKSWEISDIERYQTAVSYLGDVAQADAMLGKEWGPERLDKVKKQCK